MGMDVFGRNNPDAYFRRNVWGWRPLAEIVTTLQPELSHVATVSWGTNDGDGLDEEDALALAHALEQDLRAGRVEAALKEREQQLGRLPMAVCRLCSGTGLRTDEVGVKYHYDSKHLDAEGNWTGGCNGCSGRGTEEPWDRSYYTDAESVTEFAAFLRESGGFSIC